MYKTEVQKVLKRFSLRASANFGVKIKHTRTHNGTEFKNSGHDDYLDELGITHELSAPYTPQQNGIVECKNRSLVEMARTMLDEYKTPHRFWIEAIDTACHIINRVYLHKFFKKTAYELLTDKKPNVSYFKVSVLNVGLEILITMLNLHRKHRKVLCLVTEMIRTPIESSTYFTIKWLKLWMCGSMRLTARKESTCQMC